MRRLKSALQQELRAMGYDELPVLLPERLKHGYPIPSNTQGADSAEGYARTLDRLQNARDEVFEFSPGDRPAPPPREPALHPHAPEGVVLHRLQRRAPDW